MHVSVALEISAVETEKLLRMNMPGYRNASQVGNILCLETNFCIQEETVWTCILVKFENVTENFMSYW